jgi:hypothetical protein
MAQTIYDALTLGCQALELKILSESLLLLVCKSWQSMVASESIFKSIVSCVKDVAETVKSMEDGSEDFMGSKRPTKVEGGAYRKPEGQAKFNSSRQLPKSGLKATQKSGSSQFKTASKAPGRSKFAQRFNLTGSGMSNVNKAIADQR